MDSECLESYRPWMQQAIELADKGRGFVEPNPMVGCLILQNQQVIGSGYHQRFGGPHAEVNALSSCKESTQGATAIVTLEPCCHTGKTPPCTDALLKAGIRRVIIGLQDPNPVVDGGGIAKLRQAGIQVESGVLSREIAVQNAGFLKRVRTGKPWVIAKYAMTMDGNLATSSGDSKWISNESCREQVHQLRSRIDAIMVGSQTAAQDDPLLNARPKQIEQAGPRQPVRIVVDSSATLRIDSKLVKTAKDYPCMIVVHPDRADAQKLLRLEEAGVEIFRCRTPYGDRIESLLNELGKRNMTNIMVEGGSTLLGAFLQADQIDEVLIYLAPKLIGRGKQPFALPELDQIKDGRSFEIQTTQILDNNLVVQGLVRSDLFPQ